MKCEFRWVSPADLGQVWPTIRPGLEITAKKAPGGWIPEDAYAELKNGSAVLHTVIKDNYYRGFIISKTFESYNGKVLLIWIGYSNDPNIDVITENVDEIMSWAKNINATKVQFQSPRIGFERIAPKIGFAKTMAVFERDV